MEICPECSRPIPNAHLGGRCPQCLLRLGLDATAGAGRDDGLADPPPPSPSSHFAGYELLGEIARGGMGVVWKARQIGVNRLVALKMIPSGQRVSIEEHLRFRMEAEAVAQLDHPHIVSLHEAGEHDGRHYFSMRLIEGGNLAQWIARASSGAEDSERLGGCESGLRTLEFQRTAAQLIATIAGAIHHAHQRGILHRDLKPSNILIDAEGQPHVADFGLAKLLNHDSGVTRTESVLGSPNYMAPEQAAGHAAQVTVAADVYSLGAGAWIVASALEPHSYERIGLQPGRVQARRRLRQRAVSNLESPPITRTDDRLRPGLGPAALLTQQFSFWSDRLIS